MKRQTLIVSLALLAFRVSPFAVGDNVGEQSQKQPSLVHVAGMVNRPGAVNYRKNATIYAMIVAAGGPEKFLGTLKRVNVYRNGKVMALDLTDEKLKSETLAMPGDVIEVTHAWSRIPRGETSHPTE